MNEAEWDSLSELWVSSPVPPEASALRRVVAAHRRTLAVTAIGETALVIGFAWLTWVVLRDGIEAWELIWSATLWMFLIAAVAFAVWNRRGTWGALGESVAEYVHLTRVRAERGRRSLRFGVGLYAVEVIAIVAQLLWFDRMTQQAIVLLGVSAFIVGVWVIVARRKIARDLAIAEEFEEDR